MQTYLITTFNTFAAIFFIFHFNNRTLLYIRIFIPHSSLRDTFPLIIKGEGKGLLIPTH